MSKGGRVNQQQGYQDPFYEGSGQPYNNQPQPGSELGYPPEAESTISREPLQPNYNAPQQGFSSSPGKGVRPSPYRGGFGGGFGGYQPSPYGGGFGGGFGNYQQPSFGGGFGGPAYGQGYGMQGGIGSLLQNYSSYTQPRMPFNPYASNPYLSSGSRGFNSSPGKGMRPQPYGGGFGGGNPRFSGFSEPGMGSGGFEGRSPYQQNLPPLIPHGQRIGSTLMQGLGNVQNGPMRGGYMEENFGGLGESIKNETILPNFETPRGALAIGTGPATERRRGKQSYSKGLANDTRDYASMSDDEISTIMGPPQTAGSQKVPAGFKHSREAIDQFRLDKESPGLLFEMIKSGNVSPDNYDSPIAKRVAERIQAQNARIAEYHRNNPYVPPPPKPAPDGTKENPFEMRSF